MTTYTGIIEGTVPTPTGSGFGFKPTRYWEATADVVLADGGPLGTHVTWRHLLNRIDFTIYNVLVATLECTPPDPATPDVFYSNGLLDLQGRVTEAVVQPWEERIHSQPLEFDSLVGAWCIAAYPNGRTVFWVYSNGNVRCRRVIEVGFIQPRATNMPYTGLEQIVHIDADGRITVASVSETIVTYPIDIVAPPPTGSGVGVKTGFSGTIEGVVPVPGYNGATVRTTFAGAIEGAVPLPTGEGTAVRVLEAAPIEGVVPVPVADPIPGVRTATVAGIEGVVEAPEITGDFARVVVADEIAGDVPTPEIETATGAHVAVSEAIVGDVPAPVADPIPGTRIGVAGAIEGTVDVPAGAGEAVRVGVGAVADEITVPTIDASGIRTGQGTAQITVPIPTGFAEGLRTGQLIEIIPFDTPEISLTALRTSYGLGAITAPLPRLNIRAENPAQYLYALYRVVSIRRHPLSPYQTVTLEQVERPFDR